MACGRCGAENRDDARFCASCGGALVAACPTCGALPARPDARFCDACGASLEAAAAPGAQARKVVTILFADLVGSTAAQEGMDPESARRWMEACHVALRGAVERHQGRVVKFIGDGVMAVFGVPDVREDDAPRALRAAVALHRAIATVPAPAGLADEARFALRVGVNTGEVVVTSGDADVVGDAVNVAARLEQAARPGEVLVGETTYRLVRLVAQLRALPPLDLKGKAEPVPAFRLVSLEPPTDTAAGTPFVGRAGELERLSAVLDVAIEERRPQLVTVVGSPGVGKSRLARELASTASDRARVVEVRCDPDSTSTFAPVAAALRAAAGLDDAAAGETVVAALTALFPEEESDRERIAHVAAGLLGVEEPGLPEETFWAVRRLIENAARVRPHLFVFEDVHWAEPLLLDLIENVAEWARDVPVLLVATARPELRDLRPALVEVGRRVRAVVVLEGLAIDESRRLTRALLEGTVLPDRLLDRIAAASEGNPLFVRELVRMLVEDGALRPGAGGWEPAVSVDDIEVPPSIQAVLAARIDRLSPSEQEVLGAASVVGRDFSRGAVAALVDPATQAALEEVLEGLRRKELVESTGTYWLDEPVFRFHHALVLDAAYRRLLKAARAELHERAARWLEQKAGDLVEQDDAIGLQLERAHLLHVETGRPDEVLGHQAATRLAAAGRRALEADDQGGAASFLGRALRCLPPADPARPDLLIDRCESLLSMGDATDAGPVVDELLAVAGDDARAGAWAECFVGELANLRDAAHLSETAERVRAAADALAEQGDAAGEAKAHAVLAASLARLGRIGDSEAALDRALAAARRAGDRRRATAILAGAPTAALWGPNPVTRASGRCLDVVRVLRITSRSPAVEATSLRCQAVLEALRGRADAARRMVASARRSLEELGHEHGLVEVDLAAGTVELLAGDLEAAQAYLERAHEGFHGLGIDVDAARAAALLARVHLERGAADAALQLTTEAESLGGADLKAGIAWRSVRAEALAGRGDLVEARRLAEAAVALAAPTDALVDHADALVALAGVLRRCGDDVAAAARASEALTLYERKEASVPAERARTLLGNDEYGLDQLDEAELDHEGRAAALDSFDAEQLDQAVAEPDHRYQAQLGGGLRDDAADDAHESARTATGLARRYERLLDRMLELGLAGDWDAYAELFHPDVELIDARPLVGGLRHRGRAEVVAVDRGIVEVGVDSMEVDVLATRGDRLLLDRRSYRGPWGRTETVQVAELDEEGRLRCNVAFDPSQVNEAMEELNARYVASLPPPLAGTWRVLATANDALNRHDLDALRSTFTEDMAVVDHRPTSLGELSGETWVESVAAGFDESADVRWPFTEVLQLSDGAALARAQMRGTRDGGPFTGDLVVVAATRGDELARLEYFLPDHLDAARARYAEIARAEGAVPRATRDDLTAMLRPDVRFTDLENRASRAYREGSQLVLAKDFAAFEARVHPEGVVTDRRPLVGGFVGEGRAAFVDLARSIAASGAQRVDATPLAQRGEHLTLLHVVHTGPDGSVESAQVVQVDEEDRWQLVTIFDPQQLRAAIDLLDERYLRTLHGDDAAAFAAPVSVIRAANRADLAALDRVLAPDVEFVDHRPASLGALDRASWLRVYEDLFETAPEAWWVLRKVIALRGGAVSIWADVRGSLHGDDWVVPSCIVGTAECTQIHVYALEDAAAAQARFEELADARADRLENAATRAFARYVRLGVEGWWDEARDLVDEEAIGVDRRPTVGRTVSGRDALVEESRTLTAIGVRDLVLRPVATRGDRLAVLHLRFLGPPEAGPLSLETLHLVATTSAGLVVLDEVHDATAVDQVVGALDDRFALGLDPDARVAWDIALGVAAALDDRDIDGLGELLAPDFEAVDRRTASGWGRLDREAYLGVCRQLVEDAPDARWSCLAAPRVVAGAAYTRYDLRGIQDGIAFSVPFLAVGEVVGAQLVRLDMFEVEDVRAAEARFAELADGAS
jgi:class 3 adenylate cyclase/type II secretory pathway predicted ATPase ExeA